MKFHKRFLSTLVRSISISAIIVAWVFSPVGQYLNFDIQIGDRKFEIALAPAVKEAKAYTSNDSVTSAGTTTWTVPVGVTDVRVKVWGAGGGGGASGDGTSQDGGGGGGGGFSGGVIDVTPGQTLSLRVGDNGALGSATAGSTDCGAGGGGGGFSGIWNGTDAGGTTYLIIAGGGAGGGGGMDDTAETGGGGGAGGGGNGSNGLTGQNLSSAWGDFGDGATTGAVGGGGNLNAGTDGANGAGTTGGRGGTTSGEVGGAGGAPGGAAGGSCGSNIGGSGGGGGGAFGGGGAERGVDEGGGGGGGGSGKTTNVEGAITGQGTQGANDGTAGAGANDTDPDYSGTVGDGGAGSQASNGNGSNGNDGKIVLIWTNKITVSGTLYADEGKTPHTTSRTIKLFAATSSTSAATSTTNNGSGVFSFAGIEGIATGTPITIWADTSSFYASMVTVASTTLNNITGADLYFRRVIIKNESAPAAATSTTLRHLNVYDGDQDADIQFKVKGASLEIAAGQMLYIAPGTHFDTNFGKLKIALICGVEGCTNLGKDLPLKNYLVTTLGHTVDEFTDTSETWLTWDHTPYDVVVISETVGSANVADLKTRKIGIVTLEGANWDEFDLGSGGGSTGTLDTDWEIVDTSHYITSGQSLGDLTLSAATTSNGYISGWSNDVQDLAVSATTPTEGRILAVEEGGLLTDSTRAAERRVFFGAAGFSELTTTGQNLFERALKWASYSTEGAGAITIHAGVGTDAKNSIKFAHGPHLSNPATNVGATVSIGGNITVGGSWFASSTESVFNHNGKTVIFSSTSTGRVIYASSTPFYNIAFDGYNNTFAGGSGGGWTFMENASTTGALTITDGIVTAPPLLSILGNFTNNGTYTAGTGTTTFMGTTTQSVSGTLTESSGFGNVEILSSANWKYRKKIMLKQASSTLTDFPVLISLSDTDLAAHAQPDGDDIFFTSSDGVTRIPHEIEQYSSSTRVSVRVNASADDTEERPSGLMDLTSLDLEMMNDPPDSPTMIGMRFTGISIPQGASVHRAFIQFTADETHTATTSLRIHGENTNDAATFSSSNFNASSRSKTTAFVDWKDIPYWNTLRASTTLERTPDLSPVVQEIVNRSGWSAGNDMAFFVTGFGKRVAESYDTSASGAPLLWIEYSTTNTGGLSAWVKVPTLSSSATTDIYMYYGNTSTSSEETPSAVWDSNYKGVFHLAEDNSIRGCDLDQRICDSTSNKKHGIARGQITTSDQVTAKIGEGYHIDGDTQADDLATSSAGVFGSTGYSISIWAKAATQNDLRLYSEGGQTSANQVFGIGSDTGGTSKIRLYLRDNSNVEKINANSSKTFFDNTWRQMTWTDSNGTTALYIDGSRDPNSFDYTFSTFTFTKFSLGSLWWGLGNLGYRIVGTLDEARISNTVRSADWIAIEYDNISATSTFYSSVGQEEQTHLFAQGVKFSSNASTTNFHIRTGSTTAPSLLSISKNYQNDGGFDANSATTTFNGTSQQYIGGFATGTNAFAGLEITNTASTTFTAAASSTKGLSAVIAGSRLEFRASATSTMQNITVAGSNGNEVYLHSGTDGSTWNFEVPGNRYVSYANVKNSNACYVSGNNISSVTSTDGGGNSCWTLGAVTPGTLAISDHASGQESNKFNTSSLDGTELFAFKLTSTVESITVTPTFTIESFGEIGQSDITNVQLFEDSDASGAVDGTESSSPLGGSGTVSLTGNSGTIAFTSFTTSGTKNYIMRADVTDIAQGSTLSINLNKSKVGATGVTSQQTITPTGTVSQATHSRGDGTFGGAGGSTGGGTAGAGTETGGGGGGGSGTGDPPAAGITELIFNDAFTDTSLVNLTAHTPDTGTNWSEAEDSSGTGYWEIVSNKARSGGGGNSQRELYTAVPASSDADMSVEFTLVQVSTADVDDTIGMLTRYADTSNYYYCLLYGGVSPRVIHIGKKVAGSSSSLANTTAAIVDGDVIRCEAMGSTITMYVNGSSVLSTTDTDITAAGKGGVFVGNVLTSTDDMRNVWHIDDFKVYQEPVEEGGGSGGGGRSSLPPKWFIPYSLFASVIKQIDTHRISAWIH